MSTLASTLIVIVLGIWLVGFVLKLLIALGDNRSAWGSNEAELRRREAIEAFEKEDLSLQAFAKWVEGRKE